MTEAKKQEFGRTQTSLVWSYFKICEDNAVHADCLLCGVRMSRGGSSPNRCGTTNLRRHLVYSHKINLPSAMKRSGDGSSRKRFKRKSNENSPLLLKKSVPSKKKNTGLKKKSPVKKKQKQIKVDPEILLAQSDPVMCIKWNTYLNNMTSALPHLLHDEQFVDVTLACEGQSLKCHKILLAVCSPYFYELLSTANCEHPIIMFKDYQFWELQALVTFMYRGEVNVPQSQLPRILRVAEALQIKGLAKPSSEAEPFPESKDEALNDVDDPVNPLPMPSHNKRKRKPSSHDCCKNSHKAAKPLKSTEDVKSKVKVRPTKRKVKPSHIKRGKRPPNKMFQSHWLKQSSTKEEWPKDSGYQEVLSPLDQDCGSLPELLASDMFTDIAAATNITEGISLPEAHKVGSMDNDFALQDLQGMKIDLEEDDPGIGQFLTNGLHHTDDFDLLNHISPECRLDEDEEGRR